MSKQRKNSLLAGHSWTGHTTLAKDELLAMRYVMEKPELPVYPLDTKIEPKTYPDYLPWHEDDALKEKLKNSSYLNKGYFESPLVSNEYYSARNLIQETLFSSTQNCTTILKELSQHFTKAYKTRNEVINKISHASNNFKVPPRVTLTATKKEAWLRDLANLDVPLLTVSAKLPHGIRNKVLVDSMCNYAVPLSRAIWFTKCSLFSELLMLRRKYQSKQSTSPQAGNFPPVDVFEGRWLQEWTLQVADYVFKFSKEMSSLGSPDKKGPFQAKLNYLLSFVLALYMERLIDRTSFLNSVIRFLRDDLPFETADLANLLDLAKAEEGEELPALVTLLNGRTVNYGQILIALTLIKMFWNDILEEDFLCKFLCESLLLNYFLVEKLPLVSKNHPEIASNSLLENLKYDLLRLIASSINNLFKHNTNVTIVPNFWVLIGDVLYNVLMTDDILTDPVQEENLRKVLQLINFRNESLMLNMKYLAREDNAEMSPQVVPRRGSFLEVDYLSASSKLRSQKVEEAEHTFINRANDDNLKFVEQLDKLKLNNSFTNMLRPRPSALVEANSWRTKLKIIVYWCVTVYRDMAPSSEKILIICNYIKRKVLQVLATKSSSHLKAEFESELLESIFSLSQESLESFSMYNLYVLINELYQLKIISISSYLRKIIACGVFFKAPQDGDNQVSTDPQMKFHLSILQNLPVLNNRQCDHILKKWTAEGFNFLEHFTKGTSILQEHILDRLVNDSFGSYFDEQLQEIQKLNVGVKFLLVNWLTSQMKKITSNSSKLIHLTPSVIANVYQFYACTDNLTVFFKVFVKFVLKNENKVIIYYLETLYFICKMIMHHYNLVKFIAGNSYEAVSSASELFRLVILSYKDLLSRETDIYHFRDFWRFIDSALEKGSSRDENGSRKGGLDKLLYGKETGESPLKMAVHSTRQNDAYSVEAFKSDLEVLLSCQSQALSGDEISDCFSEIEHLGSTLAIADFADGSKAETALQAVVSEWYARVELLKESDELILYKLLETLKRRGADFRTAMFSFISKELEAEHTHTLSVFLAKLALYNVLLVYELFKLFRDMDDVQVQPLVESFMYGSDSVNTHLFNFQVLLLQSIRDNYCKEHFDDVVIYSLEKIKADPTGGFLERNKLAILSVMASALILERKWTMHFLFQGLGRAEVVELCGNLLPSTYHVRSIDDVAQLARASNEFSLPVIQTLLKAITADCETEQLQTMTSHMLDHVHFLFGPQNSFFGELFNYLDWQCKLPIFTHLEKIFLTQMQFDTGWDLDNAMVTEDVHHVLLRLNSDGTELIPIFKDFFKKFSVASSDRLDMLLQLFHDLALFLVKLLQLLQAQVMHLDDRTIHDAISIFLRLLIIHKSSFTAAMVREDAVHFLFLKNLVALLHLSYLASGHEKLQILLYDLLLLMKNALTPALSASDDLMTSPAPPLASPDKDLDDYSSSAVVTMQNILNLPEMAAPSEMSGGSADCNLAFDSEELNTDSDVSFVNQSGLVLRHCRRDLITYHDYSDHSTSYPFTVTSLALIDDTSSSLNDGCINLSLFDAYTTRENPL